MIDCKPVQVLILINLFKNTSFYLINNATYI